MSRVLVIGDTHLPFEHPAYLSFCRDLRAKHKCDTVVHIGDVIDWHSISFHEQNPAAPSPKAEYETALEHIAIWYREFPNAKVCIGNHDCRVERLAASVKIPADFIRSYIDLWNTEHWKWEKNYVIDDVFYFHGNKFGGIHPAYNAINKLLMSVVMGHIHTAAGICWKANPTRRIFGMSVGTGVDDKAIAFAYAEDNPLKSIVSAAVVIDAVPQHFVMPMGPGEKYHRANFKDKPKPRRK